MTSDISTSFTWTCNSWDTEYTIITDRLSYILYDNPTDWETFKTYTKTNLDITSNELENLVDYQSYSLRIICDVSTSLLDVSMDGIGSGCCLMDYSILLGGGYCVVYFEDDNGDGYVSTYYMTNT